MKQTFNQTYKNFLEKTKSEHIVMCFHDEKIEFAKFNERVNQIIGHLVAIGVKKGDGVAYTLPNCYDIVPLFAAIARIGAYAMPMFMGIPSMIKLGLCQKTNIKYFISTSNIIAETSKIIEEHYKENKGELILVTVEENVENIKSIFGECKEDIDIESVICDDIEENEIALMTTTTGTTGLPKIVALTQKNLGTEMLNMLEMFSEMKNMTNEAENFAIIASPLSTYEILTAYGMIFSDYGIVIDDDSSTKKFLKNIEKYKCNTISATPAYYGKLILDGQDEKIDVSSVKSLEVSMDFCAKPIIDGLRKMFNNLQYYTNGYGLVESTGLFAYHITYIADDVDEDEIYALDMCKNTENNIEIRNAEGKNVEIGEIGEIFIKGTSIVNEYFDGDNRAFEDGWFRTGDIARKIEENSFILMGRKEFCVNRGGQEIPPILIQTQINKTENILESGVICVEHADYGKIIWAFAVVKDGKTVELKDIKEKCKEQLERYMMPDHVQFIDELPRKSGVGKLDYKKMRELAMEKLKRKK